MTTYRDPIIDRLVEAYPRARVRALTSPFIPGEFTYHVRIGGKVISLIPKAGEVWAWPARDPDAEVTPQPLRYASDDEALAYVARALA